MTHDTLPTAAESPDDTVVYIVDDDEGVRQSLAALLLARGYTVHTFGGGESFLAEAALDHPGCVLLDLRMEGLSGLQVFHEPGQRHSALHAVASAGTAGATAAATARALERPEPTPARGGPTAGHRPQQQGSGPRTGAA